MKITVEFESLAEFEKHFDSNSTLTSKAVKELKHQLEGVREDVSSQVQALNSHMQALSVDKS